MLNETVSDQINAAPSQQDELVTQPNMRQNNKVKGGEGKKHIDCIYSRARFVNLTSSELKC